MTLPFLETNDPAETPAEHLQFARCTSRSSFVNQIERGLGCAVLNMCGKGFITSPVDTLVSQYSQDSSFELAEVRGQSTYACRAFEGINCEKARDSFEDHNTKCIDHILARDAFWTAKHSVTNVHFLCFASAVHGGFYPRDIWGYRLARSTSLRWPFSMGDT